MTWLSTAMITAAVIDGSSKLATARGLRDGTLVLYDVSSAPVEGRTCPLGQIGHARDGVRGLPVVGKSLYKTRYLRRLQPILMMINMSGS